MKMDAQINFSFLVSDDVGVPKPTRRLVQLISEV